MLLMGLLPGLAGAADPWPSLNSVAGIRTVHIPYNGGAPAVTALIAGDVQLLSLNPTALIPQVAAGKARVLAQTSATRSPLIADVPTVAESGFRSRRLDRDHGAGENARGGAAPPARRAGEGHSRPGTESFAPGSAMDRPGG
jgi:hypothetical protein